MKSILKIVAVMMMVFMLAGCNAEKNDVVDDSNFSESVEDNVSERKITKDMAYEGVSNYCHSTYDWTPAEENPSLMYVENGDETETEYEVKFRSYTGSYVFFYVDKSNGNTRIVEDVPTLNIKEEIGTINLYDYLK